ncbi:restriction endonuclease [Dokdonella koreensis]|uniref:restriction endonuclease n=1 Tax=Dokdonella koreensis TaxID=323415 RepID=UPI003CCCEAC3
MTRPRELKPWERYEALAKELLNRFASEFGVERFEGKQRIYGSSGTEWEIDAKGVTSGSARVVVVECRRTNNRQSQANIGALAFVLRDTGADAGIIVSPLPLQAGARKVAESTNIYHVQIDAYSTSEDFAMRFLNRLFMLVTDSATMRAETFCVVHRLCSLCGRTFEVRENEKQCSVCADARSPDKFRRGI